MFCCYCCWLPAPPLLTLSEISKPPNHLDHSPTDVLLLVTVLAALPVSLEFCSLAFRDFMCTGAARMNFLGGGLSGFVL